MPRLVIIRGPGAGRDVTLGAETVVGRAPDVEIPVDDAGASRRHCRVRMEGQFWVLEDLGSRNGTFVNGKRAEGVVPLREGDVVRIGTVELIFRGDGAAREAASVPVAPVAKVAPPAPAAPAEAPAEPEKKYDLRPRRRRNW
ncbi:MAG: FHA domain-containing protein [Planctomycetia bacterium]|nr:FHA domain-containing protein [Planctomycetia bacterium]